MSATGLIGPHPGVVGKSYSLRHIASSQALLMGAQAVGFKQVGAQCTNPERPQHAANAPWLLRHIILPGGLPPSRQACISCRDPLQPVVSRPQPGRIRNIKPTEKQSIKNHRQNMAPDLLEHCQDQGEDL